MSESHEESLQRISNQRAENLMNAHDRIKELEAKLAAANKRIEDSQKQEPVARLNPYKDGWILIDHALTKGDYSEAILLYAAPIIPPEVASCRNQCMDFCLAESLQERVAELQAQLERSKAVMDDMASAMRTVHRSGTMSNCQVIEDALARYNTLKDW